MKYSKILSSASYIAVTIIVSANISYAQTALQPIQNKEKELSILTRKNPAYDSKDSKFAGLIIKASLTNSIEFKDNLYSKEINKTEDILHKISPSLEIKSDFSRHLISASIKAEKGSYKKNNDENYTNYNMRIAGRADISDKIYIPSFIEYNKNHTQRSDPDDQNELKPTIYKELIFNTGLDYKGANINLLINTNIKNISFENNSTQNEFIDNSDRNRKEYTISASLGLAENRIISPFIFINSHKIKYDREIDDNGFKRSSNSFLSGIGLNINSYSSLLKSKIQIAHLNRSFDDKSFSDINSLTYLADITWEPSSLLALNFSGKREIIESTLDNISASIDDIFGVSAYYELAPNIFLKPKLSHIIKDYHGNNIDRELKKIVSSINVNYKLNPNIWLSGEYKHTKQKEHENGTNINSFNSNLYNISMKLQI